MSYQDLSERGQLPSNALTVVDQHIPLSFTEHSSNEWKCTYPRWSSQHPLLLTATLKYIPLNKQGRCSIVVGSKVLSGLQADGCRNELNWVTKTSSDINNNLWLRLAQSKEICPSVAFLGISC